MFLQKLNYHYAFRRGGPMGARYRSKSDCLSKTMNALVYTAPFPELSLVIFWFLDLTTSDALDHNIIYKRTKNPKCLIRKHTPDTYWYYSWWYIMETAHARWWGKRATYSFATYLLRKMGECENGATKCFWKYIPDVFVGHPILHVVCNITRDFYNVDLIFKSSELWTISYQSFAPSGLTF